MAIRSNYKGIIQAIKEKSGVQKTYTSNFWGIIEALLDLTGGGGSINVLPPGTTNPPNTGEESDGDMVAVPNGDGNYFIYVYAEGDWQRIHVTTEEVETIGTAPFIDLNGETFDNQHDINAYIWDHLQAIESKGYDDRLLWEDQIRQDEEKADLENWIKGDQARQDQEFAEGQVEQDNAFAKGQAAQDDAFAKGQAAQDDAFTKGQAAQDDVFTKGQAAQDDAFAKGQATQDKALQDEIDARAERDLQHDAQISTIEYKLDALVGLQFRGAYRFKHDVDCDAALLQCYQNANGDINAQLQCNKDQVVCEQGKVTSGIFEAVDPDDRFDHLLSIVVHETDLSGVETEWGNVLTEGDYLEIDHQIGGVADKTNYGLYRITEEPEITQNALGEDVYSFQLQFLQGDGEMLVNEIYEIRGINKDEGVNPEELADFLTKDDAQKTYLPLIGGELTGTLKMKDSNVIQTRHLDSGQNTDLQIKRDGNRRILVGTNKVVFDVPPECGSPINGENQLVTKKYVDANQGTGPKGEKGNLGAGTQGQKGARGYTGGSGSKGNRGYSGSKGSPGNDLIMQTGTSSNPTLSRGKMYLNYNYKVLYIGL